MFMRSPLSALTVALGLSMTSGAIALEAANGLSVNGLSVNGLSVNGLSVNGLSVNGTEKSVGLRLKAIILREGQGLRVR